MPVAGMIGAIAGGKMQGDSAGAAAQAQAHSTDASNQTQWQMLQQIRADNAQGRSAGDNALARMMEEMGFGVTDLGNNTGAVNASGQMVTVPGTENSGGMGRQIDKMLGTEKTFGELGGIFGGRIADPLGFFAPSPDVSYWTPGGIQNTQRYTFDPKAKPGQAKLFSGFQADPGYKFRLEQGSKALQNSQAARGGLLSGNALKAAMDYNSGQASQEYGNYWGRLAQMAGFGPEAVSNTSTATQKASNGIANGLQQGGNARASGYVAQGQMYGNIGNALTKYFDGRNSGGGGQMQYAPYKSGSWNGISDYNASEIW